MKCYEFLDSLAKTLSVTSAMAVLGFMIGVVEDHISNKNYDSVLETGGIVAGGFAAGGFLLSVGMFAVKYSKCGEEEQPTRDIDFLTENTGLLNASNK